MNYYGLSALFYSYFFLVVQTRYLDIWESATLAIKRDGYSIKVNGPGGVLVSEKFSQSTIVRLLSFAFLYS